MAKPITFRISYEVRTDRQADEKITQVFQLLVPNKKWPIKKPSGDEIEAVDKGNEHEDSSFIRTGVIK